MQLAKLWLIPLLFLALCPTHVVCLLPEGPVIAGYQNWGSCNLTKTLREVEEGVNVVIWFAVNLGKDTQTQKPAITSGPNYTCVAEVRAVIEARGFATTHLLSIGGWDAPHPSTEFSGAEWFAAWNSWNSALPRPFDGFDWDLEGNDAQMSPYNEFTPEVLNLVVDMSAAAKAAGYIVTMVPAQSYFDVSTPLFNRSLRNAYPDWHPDFHYHGLNCYAYIFAAAPLDTFDLVTVQLYETWSRADQALLQRGMSAAAYLKNWSAQVLHGWEVDFNDNSLRIQGRHTVRVKASQLVVGLSFGSTDGKSAFIWPESAGVAYLAAPPSERPRGYAFWEIPMDGQAANGTNSSVDFASSLNKFLHVRTDSTETRELVV